MKFRLKVILIFILLITIMPLTAKAAEASTSSCSDVSVTIDEYESVIKEIENINCDNTTDTEDIRICNKALTKKAYLLSKLFKMHDDLPQCGGDKLDEIIEKNQDECTSVLDSSIKDISNNILTIFYIIAPFLVIIFGSIDFTRMVATSDTRMIVQLRKNFVRRIIAMVMVYMLPFFINFIISLNISNASLDGNVYACNRNLNYSLENWETVYVPNLSGKTINGGSITVNSVGVQAMMDAAKQLNQKARAEQWYYYNKYDVDEFPDIASRNDSLIYGNIRGSVYNTTATCCATLIGDVLFLSNVIPEEEINTYRYNGATGTYYFLKEHGWYDITDYSQLQAGDVVFFKYCGWYSGTWTRSGASYDGGKHEEWGHVELYGGDNTWFNFGGTGSIRRESPYYADKSSGYQFARALRMP